MDSIDIEPKFRILKKSLTKESFKNFGMENKVFRNATVPIDVT